MFRWGEGRADYNYRNQDGGGHCGGKSAPDRNERYKGQAGSGIMSRQWPDYLMRMRTGREIMARAGWGAIKKNKGRVKCLFRSNSIF